MGREKRILVDGGVYHLINRGHNKNNIFHSSKDYEFFKDLLLEYRGRFHYSLFHYCLMPNHIHLLLRISKGNELPLLMQCVSQVYAKYYKKAYGLVGSLYQGRYRSKFVGKDGYLLECGRYIERNPLKAGLEKELSRYRYSSFNFYARGESDKMVSPNPLYEELSNDKEERRRIYAGYIYERRLSEEALDSGFGL